MAWEHEKSLTTILLDTFRHLVILAATGYAVFLIYRWNRLVAVIAVVPIYIIILNLIGFITLPLYAFTPENRLKAKAFKAFENGDFEKGKAMTDKFAKKFKVNISKE